VFNKKNFINESETFDFHARRMINNQEGIEKLLLSQLSLQVYGGKQKKPLYCLAREGKVKFYLCVKNESNFLAQQK
jgi:hypothetical protein